MSGESRTAGLWFLARARAGVLDKKDAKVETKLASGDGLDVTKEVITNPINDDLIIGAEGERRVIARNRPQRGDPGGVLLASKQLSEVWLQFAPVVHPPKLTQPDAENEGAG